MMSKPLTLHKSRVVVLLSLLGLALATSCGNSGSENDGGGSDGSGAQGGSSSDGISIDGAGATTGMGGDSGILAGDNCVGLDAICESNAECCGGNRCQDDGSGTKRCVDESVCSAAGSACDSAASCCSLSCDGTCQSDGSICKPTDAECSSDTECCSGDCQDTCQSAGSACSTLGEVCDTEGFDGDCCSKSCSNFGSDDEPDLRCARSSSCGARGELCGENSDCCSGVCVDGRCPTQNEIGGSLFAGEPCQNDADCASYACASSVPGAPKTCQFLGGCRPAGEICAEDWQCCSNLDISEGGGDMCLEENANEGVGCEAHSIEGLSVCGLNTDPKEVGEICEDTSGNKVHDCCPSDNCEETGTGVWRCSGGEGFDECREDGDTCQVAAQCCSGICSPVETDSGTELRCGSSCIEAGGLCTANADCCGGLCTDGVCSDETSSCVPLSGSCEESADCCSGLCRDGICQTVIK